MRPNTAAIAPPRSWAAVTVDIDPNAFKIIDGKLYLIYDVPHADDFAAHASENVTAADANWPKVKARLELDNNFEKGVC